MRTYRANKVIPPSVAKLPVKPQIKTQPQAWEDGKLLHGLKEASVILTHKLGDGYSVDQIRARIKSGEWTERFHWYRTGKLYKINIQAVINWQLGI